VRGPQRSKRYVLCFTARIPFRILQKASRYIFYTQEKSFKVVQFVQLF